jgi:hypothetical protein
VVFRAARASGVFASDFQRAIRLNLAKNEEKYNKKKRIGEKPVLIKVC